MFMSERQTGTNYCGSDTALCRSVPPHKKANNTAVRQLTLAVEKGARSVMHHLITEAAASHKLPLTAGIDNRQLAMYTKTGFITQLLRQLQCRWRLGEASCSHCFVLMAPQLLHAYITLNGCCETQCSLTVD